MADQEKMVGAIEALEKTTLKALDDHAGRTADQIKDLDAQLQEKVTELRKAHDEAVANGDKVSKALSERLEDFERRYGRKNGPDGGSSEPEMHAEKSIGAQVTDWLAADPSLYSLAKGGKGTGRLNLTGASVRDHVAAVDAVKAAGLHATDENVRKAMLLSDNATITSIQRLPVTMPMQTRRRVVSDLIPVQNVSVGTLDRLEYLGLAPSTLLTATSISSSGTTATLTYTAHGARVGDRIYVTDSTDTDYNGVFIVETVPTADTLTYTMAADPSDDTADGTILWANLTTWGAAATVAENALKPESKLITRNVTLYIELIAHLFRISKQMLDDVPGLQGEINSMGIRGLQELKEYKLLYGDGSSNTIMGFMNKPGVQAYTQAVASDLGRLEAFRHIVTLLENVGATATATIMNASDWESFETSVGLDDHFLLPAGVAGSNQNLWRVPILSTRWIAPGSVLMGDFSDGATLLQREGAQVSFADQDGDDFKYNRLAMRFEERLGLDIKRPEFFAKLTLL